MISQITMKRRSVLYIANFILPILFFLILDLVSFLISDSGGEKLSFKVTVLLAVTVMQLILNDILPSSSDKVPLIGKEVEFIRWNTLVNHINTTHSPQLSTALGFLL